MVQLVLKFWKFFGGFLGVIAGVVFFRNLRYGMTKAKEERLKVADQHNNEIKNSTADNDAKKAEDDIEKLIKEQ